MHLLFLLKEAKMKSTDKCRIVGFDSVGIGSTCMLLPLVCCDTRLGRRIIHRKGHRK